MTESDTSGTSTVIATLVGDDPDLMYMPLRLEDGERLVRLRDYLEGMEARLLAAIAEVTRK